VEELIPIKIIDVFSELASPFIEGMPLARRSGGACEAMVKVKYSQ